jgi:hypothetical protein
MNGTQLNYILIAALACVIGCGRADRYDWIGGMQNAAKVGTLELYLNKIIYAKKEKELFRWIGLGTATHVARSSATLKLGIDANKISADDVKVTGNKIVVKLPPIEVVDFVYAPVDFDVREDLTKNWWLVKIKLKDLEGIYRDSEAQIRQMLPYDQLEKMGQKRTAFFVRKYLEKAGFSEIYLSFRDRKEGEKIDDF